MALYQNMLLTSYCATFMILLLCVKSPCNSWLLRVTLPLTVGHKNMRITVRRNRFWYKRFFNEDSSVWEAYGLICPAPLTWYLKVVSCSNPTGPRAWSFPVAMPISAPKPNSPPSANCVEQLCMTLALFT